MYTFVIYITKYKIKLRYHMIRLKDKPWFYIMGHIYTYHINDTHKSRPKYHIIRTKIIQSLSSSSSSSDDVSEKSSLELPPLLRKRSRLSLRLFLFL